MTAAAVFSEVDRRRAEGLFAELRQALVNAERIVIEIIETRAWETLGYHSFEHAWRERLTGIRLATDAMKATVVYALLDTADVETIVAETGVRPDLVERIREQKEDGVPPKDVSVRPHRRSVPAKPHTVHIDLTRAEFLRWRYLAKERGISLADFCHEILASKLGEIK